MCLLVAVKVARADEWFRGNTHAHTQLCGHADSSPETVAKWYHDHGYNFLILSEHNRFIEPGTVQLPEDRRNDFILIPGEEITGRKTIHTTAMNINSMVSWDYDNMDKSKIIQHHVDGTMEAGGQAILNHPNFYYAVTAEDMLPVKNLTMFELFNGHPQVGNTGDHNHPSTEDMWDQLLTKGMFVYGVSSDDAHHFQILADNKSNPGRGWVMVYAPSLTAEAITKAMVRGDFYASNGVFLRTCDKTLHTYAIEVDTERTRNALVSSSALRGRRVDKGVEGYRIAFVGPHGDVLQESKGAEGTYRIKESDAYVRAKVTLTRRHPKNGLEEYYAWGQPVFLDARADKHPSE